MDINHVLNKAQSLAGYSIGELAREYKIKCPSDLKKAKGWLGQFIEYVLEVPNQSIAGPDFFELGLELKTIPLNRNGKVLESTFVTSCKINKLDTNWLTSSVYLKLNKILFIPIIGNRNENLNNKNIAMPFIWYMDKQSEIKIQQDWREHLELLINHGAKHISSNNGDILQIRPKALSSKVMIDYKDKTGRIIKAHPLGFYLRAGFTNTIMQKHLNLKQKFI